MMRLVVVGASGRMGSELIRTIATHEEVVLVGAVEQPQSVWIGRDAGEMTGIGRNGVIINGDDPFAIFSAADGVIDFTVPSASTVFASLTAQAGIVHIIGTTGFEPQQEVAIAAAAYHATIVKSGNMSLGVNMLAGLVQKAAAELQAQDFDIEIIETHHRRKIDAPSGTALLLGEAAARGRKGDLQHLSVRGRDGMTGARIPGTIGFAALRGGTVVGEHSVLFAGEGERLTLSHSAEDRSIFARGAIKAALWAKNKPHGLYSMLDVLGLNG